MGPWRPSRRKFDYRQGQTGTGDPGRLRLERGCQNWSVLSDCAPNEELVNPDDPDDLVITKESDKWVLDATLKNYHRTGSKGMMPPLAWFP